MPLTRLYKFAYLDEAGNEIPESIRLLNAGNDVAAIKFATANRVRCIVPTTSEAIRLNNSGVKVEDVPIREVKPKEAASVSATPVPDEAATSDTAQAAPTIKRKPATK